MTIHLTEEQKGCRHHHITPIEPGPGQVQNAFYYRCDVCRIEWSNPFLGQEPPYEASYTMENGTTETRQSI